MGTDLEISIMPKSLFTGGSAVSAKGITFIPNLPTEGKERCTRPVKVRGVPVEGLAFKFAGIDAEARRMGEGALVDADSPVYRSGRTFHSISLRTRRRVCPDALEGGESMSEEELKAAGCNVSLVHTDFMMGSPEV